MSVVSCVLIDDAACDEKWETCSAMMVSQWNLAVHCPVSYADCLGGRVRENNSNEISQATFGVPKRGCFDQGLFSKNYISCFSWFPCFLVPRNIEFIVFKKGLFSKFHVVVVVVSVVLVVSSVKKKNNPLPTQPPSSPPKHHQAMCKLVSTCWPLWVSWPSTVTVAQKG